MFRKCNRPPSRSHCFRPSLEPLEFRLAMAAPSITPFTDLDGNPGVRVIDGSASSELIIVDDTATDTQTLTLRSKKKPDLVLQGSFRVFDIDMGGGNDRVEFDAVGDYSNDHRHFVISLGGGRNVLDFDAATANLTNNSNIGLEVVGGKSNDFLDARFRDVVDSTLAIIGDLGAGADGKLDEKNKVIGPSRVRFAAGSDIRNASVYVNLELGTGSNQFLVQLGPNLGGSTGMLASQVEVRLSGSDRKGDSDNVTVDLSSTTINTASTLALHVDLLAGNDFFKGIMPTFLDLENSGRDIVGGALLLDVAGGKGNDQIVITRNQTTFTTTLDGLMTLLLSGGEGNDIIDVDFGGTGFFSTTFGDAPDRGLRLRADGNAGNDTLKVVVSNAAKATFFYDIQLRGNAGNDRVSFTGTNNGGAPSFGPRIGSPGVVLVDGGLGTDLHQVLGNFGANVLPVNFEGVQT